MIATLNKLVFIDIAVVSIFIACKMVVKVYDRWYKKTHSGWEHCKAEQAVNIMHHYHKGNAVPGDWNYSEWYYDEAGARVRDCNVKRVSDWLDESVTWAPVKAPDEVTVPVDNKPMIQLYVHYGDIWTRKAAYYSPGKVNPGAVREGRNWLMTEMETDVVYYVCRTWNFVPCQEQSRISDNNPIAIPKKPPAPN